MIAVNSFGMPGMPGSGTVYAREFCPHCGAEVRGSSGKRHESPWCQGFIADYRRMRLGQASEALVAWAKAQAYYKSVKSDPHGFAQSSILLWADRFRQYLSAVNQPHRE